MFRKETREHTTETERTEIIRHTERRITVHGARNLAEAQRILARHGVDIDISSAVEAHRSQQS
jgi:ribosomal protein L18